MFSSLEGFRFSWKFSEKNLVERLMLSQEKREAGDKRLKLDESDIILLKGINTGKVAISTTIVEESYEGLSSDTRFLYIVEPFVIHPEEPLYILPNNRFHFDIRLIHGKSQLVQPLIRKYYRWQLDDINCGFIRGFGEYESGADVCRSKLTAEDTRIDDFNKVSTFVNVVHPTALELGILEVPINLVNVKGLKEFAEENDSFFSYTSTWKLVQGKHYLIKNDLLYEKHKIRYSELINFTLDSNINELQTISCTPSKEVCLFFAQNETPDYKDLTSSTTIRDEYVVKKTIRIFPQLQIQKFGKDTFLLPYLGYFNYTHISFNETNRIHSQELRLIVTGGTGHYIYSSSNNDVIQIEDEVLHGRLRGKSIVRVKDSEIPTNSDIISIEVADIKDFTYLEERQEIELGNTLYIAPIGLTDSEKIFTNCTNIELELHGQQEVRRLDFKETVNDYLQANSHLVKEKLKYISPKTDMERAYLEYTKFGICDVKIYLPESEGYQHLTYHTALLDHKFKEEAIIISSNAAKAYIYSEITLVSPRFDDYFTKELLGNLNSRMDYSKTFITAPFSGVHIKFNGGISSWEKYREDYIENLSVVESDRTYSINNLKNVTSTGRNKDFYLECQGSDFEYDIQITIENRQSASLLRPGKSKVLFTLGCYHPTSLAIYLMLANSQKDNHSSIYDIPQKKGLVYFERLDTTDIVRLYAFDDNKRMFFNITSIIGNWVEDNSFTVVPDNRVSEIHELEPFIPRNHPEYIHAAVKFANFTSTSDLTYITKQGLSHYATIHIINLPYLVPSNQTLYLSADFAEIKVEGGSGDFTYELNDLNLAKDEYRNRNIRIKPKEEGMLKIRLKDNKISLDHIVEGVVYISKIKQIELLGNGLLMVNNTKYITYRVYDAFDRAFPIDQIRKMNIAINEAQLYNDTLQLELLDDARIKVRGLVAGYYTISLIDIVEKVVSNTVRFEIFPKIEVFPPYLLMIPGSSYTLSIRGGPSKQEYIVKKYKIENSQIASVLDSEPDVSAHLIGKTSLNVTISIRSDYNKLYLKPDETEPVQEIELTNEIVPVRVEFPDKVDIIYAHNRIIYTSSTIRLLAAFKKDEETFTYAIGPYSFDWNIDNTIIARMKMNTDCKEDKQVCYRKETNISNSIGVFIKTEKEGEIEAKVIVSIKFPAPYEHRRPYIFSKTEKITISDKIFLEMPEFSSYDARSALYLIPPGVEHEMHINKDNNEVKYFKSQDTKVIDINENGRVISRNKGLTFVSIEKNEKVSNRPYVPVVIPVWVTDFYSLFIEKSHQLIDMEIGQIALHKIVLQHEYGLAFAERLEGLPLRVVESHPKVAKCELVEHNSKIRIIASSKGETNIILFNRDTRKIYDVIKISVYSTLAMPDKLKLNIGATVDLISKDTSRKEYLMHNSEWISDSPDIVSVSPTGVLKTLKEGRAKVYLVAKDGQKEKISTTVIVSGIKQAEAEAHFLPSRLTDIRGDPAYRSDYR
jgi:hypothetical protein